MKKTISYIHFIMIFLFSIIFIINQNFPFQGILHSLYPDFPVQHNVDNQSKLPLFKVFCWWSDYKLHSLYHDFPVQHNFHNHSKPPLLRYFADGRGIGSTFEAVFTTLRFAMHCIYFQPTLFYSLGFSPFFLLFSRDLTILDAQPRPQTLPN